MRLAVHERSWSEPHATVHYFMAGAYAGIAGVLLSVIALTLFREGRPSGWLVLLFVTLVGGALELTMNGPTGYLYRHLGLYGDLAAWLAALVIGYTPTFFPSRPTARRKSSAADMEHRASPDERQSDGALRKNCRALCRAPALRAHG